VKGKNFERESVRLLAEVLLAPRSAGRLQVIFQSTRFALVGKNKRENPCREVVRRVWEAMFCMNRVKVVGVSGGGSVGYKEEHIHVAQKYSGGKFLNKQI